MNQFKQREDSSSPIPGAAYIRFSSEMQSNSFSLDAQLRQIKEQAERDNVEIVKVFSDPAQSAYHKRFPKDGRVRAAVARCSYPATLRVKMAVRNVVPMRGPSFICLQPGNGVQQRLS